MSVAHDHQGPFTADEVMGWPEDNNRYEVIDGALIVSPAPDPPHQFVAGNLQAILRTAARKAGAAVTVVQAVNVRVNDDRLIIPDVVVARPKSYVGNAYPAGSVIVVVEIVSPSSRIYDRSVKPEVCAEAGIPFFWRVELDPFRGLQERHLPVVQAYRRLNRRYELECAAGAGEELDMPEPFPIRFDPAVLPDEQ